MSNFLESWASKDKQNARLVAQEDLIVEVAEKMWAAIQAAQTTQKDLATHLGRSQAFVSQCLNGGRNMTLRTLADMAFVLDLKPRFMLCHKDDGAEWHKVGVINILAKQSSNDDVHSVESNVWSSGPALKVREVA